MVLNVRGLQFLLWSRRVAEKRKAAGKLAAAAAKTIKDYVETFRAGLPSSTLNSTKYSFNVYLVPNVANRKQFC